MVFLSGFILLTIFVGFPALTVAYEAVILWLALVYVSKRECYREWFDTHNFLKKLFSFARKFGWAFELCAYLICFLFEYFYLEFIENVVPGADWTTQLINFEKHQPISSEYKMGVIAIIAVFMVGLVVLYFTNVNKMPPLITALCLGALYFGSIYSVIWTIHIFNLMVTTVLLLILPVNTILISLRMTILASGEYKVSETRMSSIEGNLFLNKIYALESNVFFFPVLGLLMLIPLIGVMCIVLVLFGQAPDAAIKAFTETSDFALSTKISPQNLTVDEHYLCTVAAGGDRKIVKPIRKGIRHGHEVTVNRQLQIANAFEDVIMVKTPRAHKVIRRFYDNYGFPIAKLIKKKWIADIVYFVMKPLEYLFVVVLYLVDVHPEDRIAIQYTGKRVEDIV